MIETTAKALKVTLVLDPAPLVGAVVPDGVPRQTLAVLVDGRKIAAELASKSVRRAVAAIAEHGADGVACVLQGKLSPSGNAIIEAGLSAMPKVPKPLDKTREQQPQPERAIEAPQSRERWR